MIEVPGALGGGPRVGAISDSDWQRFRDLVRARAGIEIPDARRIDLERGVLAAREASGLSDTGALYELLAGTSPRGVTIFNDALIPAVTINETHFFRNRPQMLALEKEILPDIIERARPTRTLRIWSAACSSGEEPYSIAMLLDRLLPDREHWKILIHGTDIDHLALAKAARGVYGGWSFREVPQDIKERYFTPLGENRFELDSRIRAMVRFSRMNLVGDRFPAPETSTDRMDLVVCRNVLIYFNEHTIRQIVGGFHRSLVDDGWLVVGHAEPSQEIFHEFAVRNFPGTIVYQRGAKAAERPAATPAPMFSPPRPAPVASPVLRPPARKPAAAAAPRPFKPKPLAPKPAAPKPAAPKPAAAPLAASCQRAMELAAAGRAEDAVRELAVISQSDTLDATAPYLLAKIHAGRLQLDDAARWVEEALRRDPLAAPAHYIRGITLQERGQVDAALDAFRRCVFLDDSFVLGHFALAGALTKTHQFGRAYKSLEAAERLLAKCPRDERVPEGDGLIVGRLLELIELQKKLVG